MIALTAMLKHATDDLPHGAPLDADRPLRRASHAPESPTPGQPDRAAGSLLSERRHWAACAAPLALFGCGPSAGATAPGQGPGLLNHDGDVVRQTPESGYLWDTEDPGAAGVHRGLFTFLLMACAVIVLWRFVRWRRARGRFRLSNARRTQIVVRHHTTSASPLSDDDSAIGHQQGSDADPGLSPERTRRTVRGFLEQACAALPSNAVAYATRSPHHPDSIGTLAYVRELLDQEECEVALYAIAEIARGVRAGPTCWIALEDAARTMRFDAR